MQFKEEFLAGYRVPDQRARFARDTAQRADHTDAG
jgi:hypothetical protein